MSERVSIISLKIEKDRNSYHNISTDGCGYGRRGCDCSGRNYVGRGRGRGRGQYIKTPGSP